MQEVNEVDFVAFCFFQRHHISMDISHVLQGCTQVFGSSQSRNAVVDHRLLANFVQCSVNPFCRVFSGKAISGERNLQQREPFGVGTLSDIGFKLRGSHSLVVATEFDTRKQVTVVGNEF